MNVREWFANVIAGSSGKGDLITYFFRRAAEITNKRGSIGLIGAKAITEGDSLQVGIEPLYESGWRFYKVDRNRPWPTKSAGTNIAVIWMSREVGVGTAILDGREVSSISSLLTSAEQNLTRPNLLSREISVYEGSYFLGDGFLISVDEAQALLKSSPTESEVLKPFINAYDLNSVPSRIGPRWIIDMRERSEIDSRKFKMCWKIIEENVKPERLKKDAVIS